MLCCARVREKSARVWKGVRRRAMGGFLVKSEGSGVFGFNFSFNKSSLFRFHSFLQGSALTLSLSFNNAPASPDLKRSARAE